MADRTPGLPSAPPPPRRPGPADDALSEYLDISYSSSEKGRATESELPQSHLAVLRALETMSGEAQVEDLQKRSQLQFVDFATALVQLEEDGWISVSGSPGQEIVHAMHRGR
jgi:hypothetical protein